jgi:RNA polymerase sigma factor (sigma-70 family)
MPDTTALTMSTHRSPSAPYLRPIAHLFGPGGSDAGASDAELLDRFRHAGEPAAFESIVLRHGPLVLATCRRLLPNGRRHSGAETEAADAFQATFLALIQSAGTIRDGAQLAPWLRRTASRVCLQILDRPAAIAPMGSNDGDNIPSSLAQQREAAAILHDELSRLPATFRDALMLTYFDGLTHEEAAEVLGCPLGTVRSRVARGREKLRVRLERRGLPLLMPLVPRLAPAELLPSSYLAAATALAARPHLAPPVLAALAQSAGRSAITATGLKTTLAAGAAGLILIAGTAFVGLRHVPPDAALPSPPTVTGPPAPAPVPEAVAPVLQAPPRPDAARIRADIPQVGQAVVQLLNHANPDELGPNGAISSAIRVAILEFRLGDAAGAHAVLHAAEAWLDRVSSPPDRFSAIAELGAAQLVTGDPEAAQATFDRLLALIASLSGNPADRPGAGATPEAWAAWDEPRRGILAALGMMASAQASVGDQAGVDRTLDQFRYQIDLLPPDRQNNGRGGLLTALVRTGRFDEAFRLAIDPPALGLVFGAGGPTPEAIRKAQYDSLAAVAALRARHGKPGLAFAHRVLAWMDAHPSPDGMARLKDLAPTLAWLGDTAGALAVADREGFPASNRNVVREVTTMVQIAEGDLPGARATLQKWVASYRDRNLLSESIPSLQLQAGDMAGATDSARRLLQREGTSREPYARILLDIARIEDENGRFEAARVLREMVREALARNPAPSIIVYDPASPLRQIPAPDTPGNRNDADTIHRAQVADLFGQPEEADRLLATVRNAEARQIAADRLGLNRATDAADIPAAIQAIQRLRSPNLQSYEFTNLVERLIRTAGLWRPFNELLDL